MTTLLIAQFLIYAAAWAVGAMMLRDERPAIGLWCLYCLLQALGLKRLIDQAPGPGALGLEATLLALLAYVSADLGIDRFVNGRVRHGRLWLGLLVAGGLAQLSRFVLPVPSHLMAVAYNLSVAALLLAPMIVLQRPLRREFGLWGLLPLLPGGLICALALARSAAILADPGVVLQVGNTLSGNLALMTATLVAAGAFNIAFIALVLGRLVLRLRCQLDTDVLTGLANRGGLEKQLATAWAGSQRHPADLSVAFIDIDHFKLINDAGGHEAGDVVIRGVAEALRLNARQSDSVGRWGGDEFMVVMPHTDAEAATRAMQRLRERVRAGDIPLPAGGPALSLSIGIATKVAGDQRVQDLVQRADAQMYRLKRGRRGSDTAGLEVAPAAS